MPELEISCPLIAEAHRFGLKLGLDASGWGRGGWASLTNNSVILQVTPWPGHVRLNLMPRAASRSHPDNRHARRKLTLPGS